MLWGWNVESGWFVTFTFLRGYKLQAINTTNSRRENDSTLSLSAVPVESECTCVNGWMWVYLDVCLQGCEQHNIAIPRQTCYLVSFTISICPTFRGQLTARQYKGQATNHSCKPCASQFRKIIISTNFHNFHQHNLLQCIFSAFESYGNNLNSSSTIIQTKATCHGISLYIIPWNVSISRLSQKWWWY